MRKRIIQMVERLNGCGYKVKYIYKHKMNSTFLAYNQNGQCVAEGCLVNDSFHDSDKRPDENYELVFDSQYAIYSGWEIIGYRG